MKAASRPRRIYVVIEARIMNLDELDSETDRSPQGGRRITRVMKYFPDELFLDTLDLRYMSPRMH